MQPRTSKPRSNYYNNKAKGGLSWCITGKPTDGYANVLSNCVGYACGRFNEIIGSMKYPQLNCNAEYFVERAISLGLSVVKQPTLGGIMVWSQGNVGTGSDGAGHVEVVERIDSANQIFTSASNYGGSAFYNATRTNTNGRWGLNATYTYRGCIVNPKIGYKPYEAPKPKLKYKLNDKVIINGTLYGSSGGKNKGRTGKNVKTTITRVAEGQPFPYNTTGDLGWVAEDSVTLQSNKWTPKVGDRVAPILARDYRGVKLVQWDKEYEIMSINYRGAVLGAVRGSQRPTWATVALDNLKKL